MAESRLRFTKRTVDALRPPAEGERTVWDAYLPGLGLRLYAPSTRFPEGLRRWVVGYRVGRGRSANFRRVVLDDVSRLTLDEAREAATEILKVAGRGVDPVKRRRELEQARSRRKTLTEVANLYFLEHLIPNCKASTQHEFRRMLDARILPALGNRPIAEISLDEIEEFHSTLRKQPARPNQKKDMRATANRHLTLLSAIFSFAERKRFRPQGQNPCKLVRKFKEQRRRKVLTLDEIERLGRAITQAEETETIHPSAALGIRLLLLTGMRRSEVFGHPFRARRAAGPNALQWDQIDFDEPCIRLPDSKTGEKTLPLSTAALEILAAAPRQEGNPFVCAGDQEGMPFIGVDRPASKLFEAADIADASLHTLRHTFASLAGDTGLGAFTIARLLGHADIATSHRYVHLATDPVRAAAEAVSATVAAALSGKRAKVVSMAAHRKGRPDDLP